MVSYIRRKAIEGLKAGDTFSISRVFTEKDMVLFADITRDYNPIHFDNRYTEVKGFKGRICHGLLVASMISEIGGQIGWLATEMNSCLHLLLHSCGVSCTSVYILPLPWGD